LCVVGLVLAASPAQARDLDPSFGSGGTLIADFDQPDDSARDVALQRDGRIVVVGSVLARYTAAGSPDPTFSGDGRVPGAAAGVAIQPDGMIVTAGATVSRYRPNGSPDPGFSGDGKTPSGFSLGASAVAVQSDGKIVVAGTGGFGGASSLQVLRLNRDGSPDTGFSGDGRTSASPYATNNAAGLAIQPDGKIVVAGSFGGMSSSRFGVVRFNADGFADRSFGARGYAEEDFGVSEPSEDGAAGVAIQADGRIVLAGQAEGRAGRNRFAVVRYNGSGSLDRSFSRDGRVLVDVPLASGADDVALQPGGRIVAGGSASFFRGTSTNFALLRLNRNGSVIGSEVTDLGADSGVSAVAIQPNGGIVAAGASFGAAGTAHLALARYLRLRLDRPRAGLRVARFQRLRRVLRRGLRFQLKTRERVRGTVRLVYRRRALGRRRARFYRRGTTQIRVRLSRSARRRLRRAGRARVRLRVRVVNAEGSGRTVSRRVRLR
jgi:uncharacterized delta-60 repeat protein